MSDEAKTREIKKLKLKKHSGETRSGTRIQFGISLLDSINKLIIKKYKEKTNLDFKPILISIIFVLKIIHYYYYLYI